MDGLETLARIRSLSPKLPVIMFSSFTEHGAAVTLEALARGATEYVTKPTQASGIEGARQRVWDDLIPKIKSLCMMRNSGPSRCRLQPPLPGEGLVFRSKSLRSEHRPEDQMPWQS